MNKNSSANSTSVAVVGCGGIGKIHLSNYQQNKANIVAVADSNEDLAKQASEKFGCRYYIDYPEMFKKEKIDALSVCTPPVLHKQVTLDALAKNISVLCEKPLAISVKEGREIVEYSKKSKGILMTAFCHRFQWQVAQTKKWIDEGKLGKIVLFHNRFAGWFEGVEKTWFVKKEISGGGMFIDTLIHSIDLFRYLIGEAKTVKSEFQTFHPELKVEDTGIILLQSKSGAIGTLEGSWQTPAVENVIEVMGTKGSAYINYNEGNLKYRFEGQDEWKVIESPKDGRDRFYLEIEHFLTCVKENQQPLISGLDGLRAMEILEETHSILKRRTN